MSTTLTLSETAANAALDAVHRDGGGTYFVFLTDTDVDVATVALMDPPWSIADDGTTTLLLDGGSPLADDATNGGTITKVRLQDATTVGSTETVWWEGSVGTADAAFIMPQTTFAANERLEIQSASISISYDATL